jgi:thiamine transport system ATP-binding protein
VAELLDLVGLSGLAGRLPATLSGGERQRVALARALAASPRLLLLDEPLSALDAGLRQRLADDLRHILVEAGTTAVMVTHDHEEAFAVADDLAVMRAGRIVQSGPIAEVWAAPVDAETALFLGYARVLEGDPASRLLGAAGLPPAPAVAVRRSALAVAEDGPIAAEVVTVRTTPGQVRLVCATGLGEVDAVAPLGLRLAPGDGVRLSVERTRLAPLAAGSRSRLPPLN